MCPGPVISQAISFDFQPPSDTLSTWLSAMTEQPCISRSASYNRRGKLMVPARRADRRFVLC